MPKFGELFSPSFLYIVLLPNNVKLGQFKKRSSEKRIDEGIRS